MAEVHGHEDYVAASFYIRRSKHAFEDRVKGIESLVHFPKTLLKLIHRHPFGSVYYRGHIIVSPVFSEDASFRLETFVNGRAWEGGQDGEEGPVHLGPVGKLQKPIENCHGIVIVPKDKRAVDADPLVVDTSDTFLVDVNIVLHLSHNVEIFFIKAFKSDEDAVAPGLGKIL